MIPLYLHVSGAASRVLKSLCARVLGLHDRNPKALNCLWMCLEASLQRCEPMFSVAAAHACIV